MSAPELSVVVPCYRCADRIGGTVAELSTYLGTLTSRWEIVLVDDGSPDRTGTVVEELADDPRIGAIRLPANRGKGAAVSVGMTTARGLCRVFTDADLPYRLETIGACLERVRGGAHAVFGNRRVAGSDDHAQTLPRRVASALVRRMVGVFLGRHDVDTQCGLKAFSGPLADALFPRLRIDGFLFDVELTLLLTRAGVRLDFLPVTLVNRDESSVHLFGTGARTLRESWQLWRGRGGRIEAAGALAAFGDRAPT